MLSKILQMSDNLHSVLSSTHLTAIANMPRCHCTTSASFQSVMSWSMDDLKE